ncbi:conserved exported hypothetical protein [Candidatus Methylobacter favarea]|uniref:Ice-binding protein C-terminal domain-containing protein n=1 Tax=Candidatus Methylobacter favarea TaxID=2707345 RepID=A0A8S0XL53_9GAMM|nr:PEP-CTERM sorting domain-containing protein [Candidatus Methylobacter favarea]CAA9892562.1 conserved exported hypothetical protein [Candidatus Methylobacter favarea]
MSYQQRLLFALGLALASGLASAAPIQLITNGGFETGTFASWTVTDRSAAGRGGSWFIGTDDITTLSGHPTVGPAAGSFYAVTDQVRTGAYVLEQSFTIPVDVTSVVLSFDMFRNDWDSGPFVNAAGLDDTAFPNQHARVDIMTAVAGAFSTSLVDVVANLVAPGVDAGADPNPYTAYPFDITGLVAPGTTYKLRFGEVHNRSYFNQGVDNVSILADVAQVPEPATLALLGVGLAGLGFTRKRDRVGKGAVLPSLTFHIV